ncbi:MAG: MBL fold metallo-hydrolase [bacterium]
MLRNDPTVTYDILVKGSSALLDTGYIGLTNITLIETDTGYILVDVGHTCNRQGLVKAMKDRGLEPKDISKVFLSHLHCDHVLSIDLFPYTTEIFVSRAEFDYAGNPHPEDPWIPFMVREQISKYKLNFLEGAGDLASGVRFIPAPGHTPGCYALVLNTREGNVVVAQDAIKFPKEAISGSVDHAFDTPERASATIRDLLSRGDRVIPGHYSEIYKKDGNWTWDGAMDLNLRIR